MINLIIAIVFAIVVVVISEIRMSLTKKEKEKLEKIANDRLKEIKKLRENIEVWSKYIEQSHNTVKDLADSAMKLTHDYSIIARLLEDEIGVEEANRRYNEKKNRAPKDLNELIKEVEENKKGE